MTNAAVLLPLPEFGTGSERPLCNGGTAFVGNWRRAPRCAQTPPAPQPLFRGPSLARGRVVRGSSGTGVRWRVTSARTSVAFPPPVPCAGRRCRWPLLRALRPPPPLPLCMRVRGQAIAQWPVETTPGGGGGGSKHSQTTPATTTTTPSAPTTGRRRRANGTSRHIPHSPGTPTTGLRGRGNDTGRSTSTGAAVDRKRRPDATREGKSG